MKPSKFEFVSVKGEGITLILFNLALDSVIRALRENRGVHLVISPRILRHANDIAFFESNHEGVVRLADTLRSTGKRR